MSKITKVTNTNGRINVVFSAEEQEILELRAALKKVDEYKSADLKAFQEMNKYKATDSGWHMIEFAVRKDSITLHIKDGY